MESFFRYISYVDYYKNGEKIRNAGFFRWKLSNRKHYMEMQLKGIPVSNGNYDIQEKNTGKRIGKIVIDKGIGSFTRNFAALSASGEMYLDIPDGRLYLSDVKGFRILLKEKEYLWTPVDIKEVKKNMRPEELRQKINENQISSKPVENKEELNSVNEKIVIKEEKDIRSDDEKERNTDLEKKADNEMETILENILMEEKEEKLENPFQERKIELIEPIHEDKWKELCKKYPLVHPFANQRNFLSVKLEDFIILQQGYQKLAQNSFLLHGFYNYGHMILGKLSDEEEAPVYIGVPGVYYEREKQAAQMFGFAGFESAKQPVQAGSYGYYMIEVKI